MGITDYGSLAIDRFAERVDDAAEQAFADWHRQQPAGGFDFAACLNVFAGSEQHHAHLCFFQVEGQTEKATAKVDHFIEHDLGEAFHFGGAVTDFTDHADVGGGDRRLEAGDAAFEFLQDVAHDRENVKSRV